MSVRHTIVRRDVCRRIALVTTVVAATIIAACRAPVGYEQAYLASLHNFEFRKHHQRADRIFNGFDYGHAILYESLLADPKGIAALEGPVFNRVTTRVLVRPPSVTLEEAAIGPRYATLIPEVVAMFDWAHILHRQLYDIWAAPNWSPSLRDAEVQRVLKYYKSRPDLAFSSFPKSMDLMEGQPYSQVFRQQAPRYNGLMWSYHWMQMALYDALMADTEPERQRVRVDGVVNRFFALIADPPSEMPTMMPMSAAVAPLFATRYPEAAIIFDNLHALHDVVSDILLSDSVPASGKRAAVLHAAAAYRDSTTEVTTRAEWLEMSQMMTEERLRPPPR